MNHKQKFNAIKERIENQPGVHDMTVAALTIRVIDGNGRLSEEVRAIYRGKGVPEEVMDLAEQAHEEAVKSV